MNAIKKIKDWFKGLSKTKKALVILAALLLIAMSNVINGNSIVGKRFMYLDEITNVGAVIEFDKNMKCSFFLRGGPIKKMTLGSYNLDKNSNITFYWDKEFGPKSGKIIKGDGKNPWKIDIGTAVYIEYKE